MRIADAIATTLRFVALLGVSWLLVAFASPTPDPFIIVVAWLGLLGLLVSIPMSRVVVSSWIRSGRLRGTSA